MTDDDLRFGNVDGKENKRDRSDFPPIVDKLITIVQALIVLYVALAVLEIMFNIPIPII